MLKRLWLHALSRVAEEKAKKSLARAIKNVADHVFFCAQKDEIVHTLRANNADRGD
jgi:hypothetical protein